MFRVLLFFILLLNAPWTLSARVPELTPQITYAKLNEIMKSHASYQTMTPELIKRTLQNYLELLDPTKTYFIEADIEQWLNPSDYMAQMVLNDYQHERFTEFAQIQETMKGVIQRHRQIEKQISLENLPTNVSSKEFKNMPWTKTEDELAARLSRIRALQLEAAKALKEEDRDQALQRILKHQTKREEEILNSDQTYNERLVLSNFLKSAASALDTHTAYLTPEEASQFMISVQQRLLGIGVQLRDDVSGFTIVKLIAGGPAAVDGKLKLKDRIIAVSGESVLGMDIIDAVERIRGPVNTKVMLTVLREVKEEGKTREEKLDFEIPRGEVVLKETRYEISEEPFGDGMIGYVRLYTFYQDADSASATDLSKEIRKLKEAHKLKGIILDLRYNSGGLLTQAIDVTGLFITKGVVASIKDSSGSVQHLRELNNSPVWDGPLLVLVNRLSASAAEIVAQTLQDYGRAIVVGDDHTFGKGSFQTFTLSTAPNATINPSGEYKVTRGRYYTVSGKTPQLTGVISDVVIPGVLSESEIGEKFAKYPLGNDSIKENFDDDLADIPFTQRNKARVIYKFNLQPKLTSYTQYLTALKTNSAYRITHNKNYQKFLKELKQEDEDLEPESEEERVGHNDLQLQEAYNIMKDMVILIQCDGHCK